MLNRALNMQNLARRSQHVLKRAYYHASKPQIINLEGIKIEVDQHFQLQLNKHFMDCVMNTGNFRY
jgi:hypothetical protein